MADGFDLVIKIGSMAMIRKQDNDIDYNILSRLSAELRPGVALVSSGAAEIGRLDHVKRMGAELIGDPDETKTDYSAQGQAILMAQYRQFIRPEYGVRQLLVEHTHFNEPQKREHIRRFLMRTAAQRAVPIINYNDPVSAEENRKFELMALRQNAAATVVECVDNDETAAVIAALIGAKVLVNLTSAEGIYQNASDFSTSVPFVGGATPDELEENIRALMASCVGASRAGAQGMRAKLEYAIAPARAGTVVIIGHSRHRVSDLVSGQAPCTRIALSGR